MPEIYIHRRRAVPWWVWLFGALLLALIIWWIAELATPEPQVAVVAPRERVAGVREEIAEPREPQFLQLAVVLTDPARYVGRSVFGNAMVGEVVSDRGFWLLDGGRRIFTVISEPPGETIDINEGQRVHVSGTLYDARTAGQEPVRYLEQDARQILEREPFFLHVRAEDVAILDRPPVETAERQRAPVAERRRVEGTERRAAEITRPEAVQPDRRAAAPLAEVFANPAGYIGRTVSGTANVVSDVSDRGFWMEENGRRVFAVIDEPVPETIDINQGQRIRFTGTVMDATRAAEIPGVRALEKETQIILENQPGFILVKAENITILSRP